jgi:chromosome segregation ATPase
MSPISSQTSSGAELAAFQSPPSIPAQEPLAEVKDIASVIKLLLSNKHILDAMVSGVSAPVQELLDSIASRVPAALAEVPRYSFPNPYGNLQKSIQELESPPADYTQIKRFIEIVESRIASGTWTPYFDVLKDKFEKVYTALKNSRNQKLGEMLLQRQADVNRVVKDVTEKPEIAETLSEKQRMLDGCLQRLQASLSSLQQLEAVGFDSRAEKQLRELLPLCDEIETLVDDKIQQLDTLREIYADFAALDEERSSYMSVMSAMSVERHREREQCANDLQTLQSNFLHIKDEEAQRSLALEAEISTTAKREGQLDQEDHTIAVLISRLVERYESNQLERRKLAGARQAAEKELVDRAHLLTDHTELVEQHQQRLQSRMSDLSAASEAIKSFLDGTLKEIDQLDKMTAGRYADYKRAYIQSIKEKYETCVHHYRVVFKKIHALKNFKATSQKLISELQMNLRRWSELKRAAMVDTFNEQIGKSQQELRAADEEASLYAAVLSRLDNSFEIINFKMEELGEQPLIHPGLDVEAECLEQDRRRLEEERVAISDNRTNVEDELRMVNSRLETTNLRRASSQLLGSSVAPALVQSQDVSSSFVQVSPDSQ